MLTATHMLRCFIVEDSPVVLRDLTETLEQVLPIRVVGSSGTEASATAWLMDNPRGCDLLLLDVFLKTGIGLNVLVAARRHASQAHKVVLTNHATREIRQRCMALQADRVFDKSGELEDLIAYCSEVATSTAAT